MKRHPTVSDRIAFVIARHHGERVYARFRAAVARSREIQRRVLLAKIRRNADSDFGRAHHFDSIRGVADFRRRVPLQTYEDHQPYIERVKAGDTRALFGRHERVHMFALTSGTTDAPKYIPVTTSFLDEYRAGWNAFGIKALLDHPAAFLRPILQITSRMDETRTEAGIPCGAITGLMAATQKRLVRKYYIAPRIVAEIDDPTAKYYTIMRLAVPGDVAFAITASPATQLKLARLADERREVLIKDIHDGTLSVDGVPAVVRAALSRQLRPDREAARRLEGLAGEHGALLPRHYWNLEFLANWTGGTMGLYLRDFARYFGDVPVRDIGLLASEGRMSIPVEDGTAAGVLDVMSHFYEFVPHDRAEEVSPPTLLSHELDVGAEYDVVLTTSSGLFRYRIGDVIRVVGFLDGTPLIEFLNKGEHTCSLAGEKLTEHQVIMAMEQASAVAGVRVCRFVLAPRWGDPPGYRLHLEEGAASGDASARRLAEAMDDALGRLNVEYASRRQSARLAAVRSNVLPTRFLGDLHRREAESRRKGNEQYKPRYLYCRPGEDVEFPLESTGAAEPRSRYGPAPSGPRQRDVDRVAGLRGDDALQAD